MTCKDIFNGSTGNRATVLILEAGEPKTGVAYNAAGLVIAYRIDTGSQVAITLTSGNWFEIGGGKYVVDVPDSVYLAANLGRFIQFYGSLTDCAVYGEQHRVVANDPSASIAEAVAQYDQRDEEGTPGTIGWYFKKLRQANNTVEAVVTNDITPTATTFSVALTTYPTGAFKHSVLAVVEDGAILDQNSPILTFTNNTTYSTIVLEEAFTQAPAVGNVLLINVVSHVHSVASIAAGVWETLTSTLNTVGSTGRALARLIGLVEDSSGDRFTAKAVELTQPANVGDWSITRTFQVSGGDKVSGVRMSLVGVAGKTDTTGTDGIATIKADDGTFTLRVVVPAGYEDVADTTVTINGADSTATVTLVATTVTPVPPSPDACVLSIYVRNQATEPFPGVTVTGRFPRGWSVADGAMNINEVVTATTDANGLAQLVLLRDQDYDLSFARENGTVAKIRITTPDAATATLNQSYQG